MKIKIILLIVSLLISGCVGPKTTKNPSGINDNVGSELANEIKRNCQNTVDQCWNSLDNLISGNITMEGQVLNVANGKVYVNTSSIFNVPLPNIPTVLSNVNKTNKYDMIKMGQKIKFSSNIKPLNPAKDVIIFAIITSIFPNEKIVEAQKAIRLLQKFSKMEMLIELSDVKIMSIQS